MQDDSSQSGSHAGNGDELQKKLEEAQQAAAQNQADQMNQDVQQLQQEVVALKLAHEEAQTKALRALADLQNARRRMEEEKASFAAFAGQSLVLKVLEIYENYHRLLEHKPEGMIEGEWLKGLELIDQQFQSFLEQQGVKKLEVKAGDMINPEHHEAVMSGEGVQGSILEVFSPGYEMKGRIIKTAKVKVGRA